MNRILSLCLVAILLASAVMPVLPAQQTAKAALAYPNLPTGQNYYQTTFPAGLKYSQGWWGTFANAGDKAMQVYLFDDDWLDTNADGTADWGRCIFSAPPAPKKQPSQPQGGTTLTAITREAADAIIKSYPLTTSAKPFDTEIKNVMPADAYFVGVWMGDKLKEKWDYGNFGKAPTYVEDINSNLGTELYSVPIGSHTENVTEDVYDKVTDKNTKVTKQVTVTDYEVRSRTIRAKVWSGNQDEKPPTESQTVRQKQFISEFASKPVKKVDLEKYDPERYAILPAATTSNWGDATTWSASSGGATGASVPTNADGVSVNLQSVAGAAAILSVNVAANCLSCNWTGALNTPTLAHSAALNVYGEYTGIAAMAHSGDSEIEFVSNSQVVNVTFGVAVNTSVRFGSNSGLNLGQWTVLDALNTGTGLVGHRSGTLIFNNVTVTCGTFSEGYTNTRTITMGSSTINCTAFTTDNTNLTVTANTATINVLGTGACALGAANWNGASFNLNGTAHTVSGSPTGIGVFTRNGTATKTDSVTFTSGATVTCAELRLFGNSATNRVLVQSSTLGTVATVNATAFSADNVDLMDFMTGAPFDISANSTGDCGGNTNITFTPAVAQTWDGTTSSWSTAAKWTSRVPLPQDDVSAGGAGNTITVDMPRIGKSITFTGTPTVTLSNSVSLYGSKTLVSGMTWTPGTNTVTMRGRAAYTITTAGKTLYNPTISAPGGTYTLQDAMAVSNIFALTNGTFVDGGQTITLSATTAITKWNLTGGSITATGTIVLTSSGANAQTFAGGGLTYNNVTVQGTGAYALTLTGNNVFNTFYVNANQAAKAITATGTTQTVSDFTRNSGTNAITITNGTWTKADATPIALDYLNVFGSTANPINVWYAGSHSADGGGNTRWLFTDPTLTVALGAVSVAMDKDATFTASVIGTVGPTLHGSPTFGTHAEYGSGATLGNSSTNVTRYATGAYTNGFTTTNLTPGGTMFYNYVADNGAGSVGNVTANTPLTMPTTTTGASSIVGGSQVTLNGAIATLGIASSVHRSFEYWGLDGVVHTTTETTGTATGTYSDTVEGVSTVGGFSYRSVLRVGTVYAYGSTATLTSSYTGSDSILQVTPLIIWLAVLVAVIFLFNKGYWKYKEGDIANGNTFWMLAILGIAVNVLMFGIVLEAIQAILGG